MSIHTLPTRPAAPPRLVWPLTEAELDAHIAYQCDEAEADAAIERSLARPQPEPEPSRGLDDDPSTLPPPLDYAGCTGNCNQGRRACNYSRAHLGMWDAERRHPWAWGAFYAAVVAATIIASLLWPLGFAA